MCELISHGIIDSPSSEGTIVGHKLLLAVDMMAEVRSVTLDLEPADLANPPPSATEEWRANWPLTLVSAAGVAMGGMHIYSLGAFIIPLGDEFGWTRAQISAGLTIIAVFSLACSALVGMLIDRLGPRRIALTGITMFCSAVALLATTGPSIWHWWALWVLIGIAVQFAKPTVWTAAVAGRFAAGRGFAIAVALSGAGVSAAITPPIANYLIEQVGWRGAYLGLGGFWALMTFPLSFLFFYGVQDGTTQPETDRAAAHRRLPGLDLKESFRSTRFLKLMLVAICSAVVTLGLLVHFIPMVVHAGMSSSNAAGLAGLIGVCSTIGRLGIGALFDRVHGPVVGAFAFLLPAVACILMLIFDGSIVQAAVIACCIGLALGAETDVMAYLTSRYFGIRNYGALFGMLIGVLSAAAGIGPLLAGAIFDYHGSYGPFFVAGIPLTLIAVSLTATLGRYPSFPPTEDSISRPTSRVADA